MRINSGTLKGRQLHAPPGLAVRPTSDKVKQALFNILSARIEGAVFLDLYAGTGSVGIEALSRGAKQVFFVEKNREPIEYLKRNLSFPSFQDRFLCFCTDAVTFLKRDEGIPFDIAFLDPPYEGNEIEKTLPLLGEDDMITDGGRVIVQHFHKKALPEQTGKLKLSKKYTYGDTLLSFYENCGKT
ncbi:MAG: 16S rRNA (guanine(966)-N(2))-methyltransferase RsmD [Candidatus Manganitrophaceae bacterium]